MCTQPVSEDFDANTVYESDNRYCKETITNSRRVINFMFKHNLTQAPVDDHCRMMINVMREAGIDVSAGTHPKGCVEAFTRVKHQ